MRQNGCGRIARRTTGRIVALAALAALAFGLLAPTAAGQRIPEPGPPQIVATQCPGCKEWIDTPHGRPPSACPRCGFSFVRQASPVPRPVPPKRPQLKPIDPFGDYLFFDVPLAPDDGKIRTKHLDPQGLAARAEEWGKQMRQMDDEARKKHEAQLREFERNKQRLLAGEPEGAVPGKPRLTNFYSGDPTVVDLSGKASGKPRLLRNPYQDEDAAAAPGAPIGGALTEHQQIRQFSDQARYAHMRPAELDALAAQYPDNAEIQQAAAKLKARIRSMDSLAATSEQVRWNQETSESEQKKGNREALRATATALDLAAGVPTGLDEVYSGEKTVSEWLGIDVASSHAEDRFKDFAIGKGESFALRNGWNTPGPIKKLGGLGSVVDGVSSIEDLIDYAKAVNAAGDHYVIAAELRAQAQAAGGTVGAVGSWSYVRRQAQDESARLYRLIQEEEARRR